MARNTSNRKALRTRTSLSYKLTAYFIVFGLIIGYSAFIFLTASSGHNILKTFSSSAVSRIDFEQFNPANFSEADFSRLINDIQTAISTDHIPITEINAFIQSDDKWKKYSFVDHEIRTKTVTAADEPLINSALEKDMVFSGDLFLGKSDTAKIFFSLTPHDGNRIVMSAAISRTGLKDFLFKNQNEFIAATIILLVLSFLLGKIFSLTVTRPLRVLSSKALRIAEGEQNVRLPLKRRDEIGVLSRTLGQMSGDLEERLKAMEIMNRIDKAVLSSISRKDLLHRVVGFVCEYIDKSTAVMALRNDSSGGFELISAAKQSESAILIDNPYIPDKLLSNNTLEAFRRSCIFSEDKNLNEVLIKQLNLPAKVKRFYNVALYLNEKYLGSLLVIKDDQQPFTNEQQQTLRKLGDQVGVALQSVMAVEEINSLQIGSIQALSRSIDAKSRWTAGHSERVAELSEMLGNAAGMEEMQLRRLVISALLHDIGKIGISENILDKPGRLTDEEFSIVKQHPEVGYEISRNIPNYEDICDGIRYHHERWNGTGYPSKLGKNEIPRFGRIIAIADVFDALSADRPYRKGLTIAECLQFIDDKKGTDFDTELAEIFIETVKNSNSYLINL